MSRGDYSDDFEAEDDLPVFEPFRDNDEDAEVRSVGPEQSGFKMGALKSLYNVTSNIQPDDPGESSSGRRQHGVPVETERHLEDGATRSLDSSSEALPSPSTTWTSPIWRYMPAWLEKSSKKVITWAKGPVPPRPWAIRPFFPRVQAFPLTLLDRWAPMRIQRFWLLMFFYFCWLLCFVTVLHYSAFADRIPGYGSPTIIDCTSSFWSAKNGCGTDGNNCRPFNNTDFAFRCPASCSLTQVLNPRAVGAQEINYQPLVIGGPTDPTNSVGTAFYRGDSFICAAAIHAGFISDEDGGCGVVSAVGEGVDYPSSKAHGIPSVGFDSNFPLTFKFLPGTQTRCKDLRWPMLGMDIVFSTILSLFTTSPAIFFTSIFSGLFLHTALVSDPPSGNDYYELVSTMIGNFLPAAFVAFVLYKIAIRKTLTGLRAQVEKSVLWLGPCWVGALNNYTFDKIPISRLTPRDIQQQPGAVFALIVIIVVILAIALGQAWAIRIAGLMPRYLAIYGTFVFCLLMFVAIPNLNLRIHHYFLAMLFIPGTFLQTRPSLVYQGLLVGFFINGIARWGFAPILETPGALLGDGQIGNSLPSIGVPVVNTALTNITFDWGAIPYAYDTVSVLVNDVERYRGYGNYSTTFTWDEAVEGHPQYFRFGYMSGSATYDYTKAGIWEADGTWTPAQPGPSK